MKTRTPAILMTLLAGAVTLGAYPNAPQQGGRQQRAGRQDPPYMEGQRRAPQHVYRQSCRQAPGSRGQRRGAPQFNRREQTVPQFRTQRQGARQWNRCARGPHNPQECYAPQQRNWGPRGDQRLTLQQREKAMRRHRAALKRFDQDGDGNLSKKERKAARKAVQQRKGDRNPGESPE